MIVLVSSDQKSPTQRNSTRRLKEGLHAFEVRNVTNLASSEYTKSLDNYTASSTAKLQIVLNKDRAIDHSVAQIILLAMIKQQPVILLHPPDFASDVNYFSRGTIMSRLNKLLICDVSLLDDLDLRQFIIAALQHSANYVLTKHEKILIRSLLRAHFRKLLSAK